MSLSDAGCWLCERHSDLQELVQRIGAWEDGAPVMWMLRETVAKADGLREKVVRMAVLTEDVAAALIMSPGEFDRLRLLATLAPRSATSENVKWCVEDMGTFDAVGKDLIEDWLRAVRIGVLG